MPPEPATETSALDLRKLPGFLAVAEELNFTRAAERLHMTQQALSSSIGRLERELGVRLLERSTRQVELTEAGEALLGEAPSLLAAASAAVERTRRAALGEAAELRVGHSPAISAAEIGRVARALREAGRGLTVSSRQLFPDELAARVRSGDLDLGLVRWPPPDSGLAHRTVGSSPLRIAVASGHRLADREAVTVPELASETIVVFGRPGRSGYTEMVLDLCRSAGGFEPRVVRSPLQGTAALSAVVEERGVAFVAHEPGPAADGTAAVVELDPEPSVPLVAIWREPASHALAGALAALGETG